MCSEETRLFSWVPVPSVWHQEYPRFVARRTTLRLIHVVVLFACMCTFGGYSFYRFEYDSDTTIKISDTLLESNNGWECESFSIADDTLYRCSKDSMPPWWDVLAIAFAATQFVYTLLVVAVWFVVTQLCSRCIKVDPNDSDTSGMDTNLGDKMTDEVGSLSGSRADAMDAKFEAVRNDVTQMQQSIVSMNHTLRELKSAVSIYGSRSMGMNASGIPSLQSSAHQLPVHIPSPQQLSPQTVGSGNFYYQPASPSNEC